MVGVMFMQTPKAEKGIMIEAKRRYASSPMSEVERVWLIQEIRDWLDPSFRNFRVKPGIFTDEMLEADFDEWIYKKEDFEEWTELQDDKEDYP